MKHMDDTTTHDDELDPEALFASHKQTGEPLSEDELDSIVAAGLAARSDFGMRGGNLWWHDATFPDIDDDEDDLPAAPAAAPPSTQ